MSEFITLEHVIIHEISTEQDQAGFVDMKTSQGVMRAKQMYIEKYELVEGWEGKLIAYKSNNGNFCLAYDQTHHEYVEDHDDPWLFECHALVKPISVNKAWYMNKKKSKDYEKFQEEMIPYLQGYTAPQRVRDNETTLSAEMIFGFSSVKSDVDNCIKTTLDTMQSWFGFDDRIIFELSARKYHVKRGDDYLKIKLQEIKETDSGSNDDT